MILETRTKIKENKLSCNNQHLPCLGEEYHEVIAIQENATQNSIYQCNETRIIKEPSSEENANNNKIIRLQKITKKG